MILPNKKKHTDLKKSPPGFLKELIVGRISHLLKLCLASGLPKKGLVWLGVSNVPLGFRV